MNMHVFRGAGFVIGTVIGLALGVLLAAVSSSSCAALRARRAWLAAMSDNRDERLEGEEALGRLGLDRSRRFLLNKVRRGSCDERLVALSLLGQVASEEEILELGSYLESDDAETRLTLLHMLAGRNSIGSLELLKKAIASEHEQVRIAAAVALIKFGVPIRYEHGDYIDIPSGFEGNPGWPSWKARVLKEVRWNDSPPYIVACAGPRGTPLAPRVKNAPVNETTVP